MEELDNLNRMMPHVKEALLAFEPVTGRRLTFEWITKFKFHPGKGYFARANATVRYRPDGKPEDTQILDPSMVIVAFMPGDSTGSGVDYDFNALTVPKKYIYTDKPWKVIPRKKDNPDNFVLYELFFPLLSFNGWGLRQHAVSLEELTLRDDEIVLDRHIGLSSEEFGKAVRTSGYVVEPRIQLTAGYLESCRFGDPHAIHHGLGKAEGVIQIAGFLAVKDAMSPVIQNILSQYCEFPE